MDHYEFYGDQEIDTSDWIDVGNNNFVPMNIAYQWDRVQDECRQTLSEKFSITSAYRSPAYQFFLLCKKDRTLSTAFKTLAPPFYSKH